MQFQFHKFAFCQTIYIFHIQHNSLIEKCCEYIFDKAELWDFEDKKMFLVKHQKA